MCRSCNYIQVQRNLLCNFQLRVFQTLHVYEVPEDTIPTFHDIELRSCIRTMGAGLEVRKLTFQYLIPVLSLPDLVIIRNIPLFSFALPFPGLPNFSHIKPPVWKTLLKKTKRECGLTLMGFCYVSGAVCPVRHLI